MDDCLNGEMLTISQRCQNKNFSGNNNVVQVLSKISNFVVNGSKNKIFLNSKISNLIVNGNSNIINVENQSSGLGNIILNGNNNRITLSRRNYSSLTKFNNGLSNNFICTNDSQVDSDFSVDDEEFSQPNIRINIGSINQVSRVNITTNVNGFVNRVISQSQFSSNDSGLSDEPDEPELISEEESDESSQEGNYSQGMDEQEKVEIKEKLINNFTKYKFSHYQRNRNNVKQEACAICLDSYRQEETVIVFSCNNHIYHEKCLYEWLQSSDVCPICKHNLMDEVDQYSY